MLELSKIHTPCKDCYFAVYENISQTGCNLGMLERYRNSENVEVLEAYDNDKEFYIINKKKCTGYKEEKYFAQRGMSESSLEERKIYVQNRQKMNYCFMLNGSNLTKEELKKILETLKLSEVHPATIQLLVRKLNNEILLELKDLFETSGLDSKWKISELQIAEENFKSVMHKFISIDNKHNFFLVSDGDTSNIDKLITYANDLVYGQFKRFIMITNQSKESVVFSKAVYRDAYTNHRIDIFQKTEEHIVI